MDKLQKSIYSPEKTNISQNQAQRGSYQEILMYFMDRYKNKPENKCFNMEFVPESKINIIGVRQYKPYNVTEAKKFHTFINK